MARGTERPGRAFISYSRTESAALAVALQPALERFAKPWHRLRSVQVFRDDSSMAANADLAGTIEKALQSADWFILLASPAAAQSPWVEREIAWWLQHRTPERIMLVLAGGELAWDPGHGFRTGGWSAMPPVLARAYAHEPRWVDARWFAAPGSLGPAEPRFAELVADLAAPLHGRDKADLVGENVRQHRRALRLARAAVAVMAVLLVLSLIATVLAVRQQGIAGRERDEAVRQNRVAVARQLAATAVNLADSDLQQASLVAVQAYRLQADPATASALYATAAASPHLVGFLDAGAPVTATAGSPDGRYVVAGTSTGQVWRWDRDTGTRLAVAALGVPVVRVMTSDDGRTLAAWGRPGGAAPTSGRGVVWRSGIVTPADHEVAAVSPSGRTVVEVTAATDDGQATLAVQQDDRPLRAVQVPMSPGYGTVVLPDDDRMTAVDESGPMTVVDLSSGRLEVRGWAETGAHAGISAVDATGRYVTVTNGATVVAVSPVVDSTGGDPAPTTAHGRTPTPYPVDYALSPGARRLATSANGRIWVGRVTGAGTDPPAAAELTGAGTAQPGTLRFLGQRWVVSGSGSAVGVWDLDQESRLGPRIPVTFDPSCNGCGGGQALVNPSGTRVLLSSENRQDVALVDLRTGAAEFTGISGGSLTRLAGLSELWLDDDHLFTWDDIHGRAAIWSGPTLDRVDQAWDTPEVSRPADADAPLQFVLAQNGDRVVIADSFGRVLECDLAARTTRVRSTFPVHDPGRIGLDPTGQRAWVLTGPDDPDTPPTHVQVFDTATGAGVLDQSLDAVVSRGSMSADRLYVWGETGPMAVYDPVTGRSAPAPWAPAADGTVTADQRWVFGVSNGTATVSDLALGSQVGTFPTAEEAYAHTDFGVSADGRTLVVATEAFTPELAGVRVFAFGYDAWQQVDCRTAGRDLTPAEWSRLTELAAPDLRC